MKLGFLKWLGLFAVMTITISLGLVGMMLGFPLGHGLLGFIVGALIPVLIFLLFFGLFEFLTKMATGVWHMIVGQNNPPR